MFTILSGLHTSNLCWPTCVGKFKLVCVNDTATCWQTVGEKLARIETSSICHQQFANMLLCRSHTPIWVLPTRVGQHKFDVWRPLIRLSFCFQWARDNFFLSPEGHKMYIYVICNLFCTGQNCVVNSPVICSITLFSVTSRKIFQA